MFQPQLWNQSFRRKINCSQPDDYQTPEGEKSKGNLVKFNRREQTEKRREKRNRWIEKLQQAEIERGSEWKMKAWAGTKIDLGDLLTNFKRLSLGFLPKIDDCWWPVVREKPCFAPEKNWCKLIINKLTWERRWRRSIRIEKSIIIIENSMWVSELHSCASGFRFSLIYNFLLADPKTYSPVGVC